MYYIFKDNEYFGVCYDNLEMAVYVCLIFSKTLGCDFNIRKLSDIAQISYC